MHVVGSGLTNPIGVHNLFFFAYWLTLFMLVNYIA